jgi:PKD domain-containing protein
MLSRASTALAILGLAVLVSTCSKSSSPTATATPSPAPPTVAPLPPTTTLVANTFPDFKVRPNPPQGSAPLLVNFNLCPSAGPVTDPVVFSYEFGDGEVLPGPPCRREHVYARGHYTANMCVSDKRGMACTAYFVRAD